MTYSEWRKKKREEEEKAALTAQEKAMGGINNANDNIAPTSSQFVTFEEWQKNKNGEKDEEESTVVADDSPKTFAEWAKMMSDEAAAQGQILKKPNTTKVDSYSEWRKMKRAEANGETYSRGGNKDAIFKSGGFDDGVDGVKDFFGDLLETTAGTLGDAILGIVHGARSGVEGIEDELKYVAAGISDLTGNDAHAERLRTEARRNTVEEEYGWMRNSFDDTSVLGNPADTLMEIGGQQIPALMAGPYGLLVTGVSAAGNATSAAYADIEAMGDAYTGNKDLHAFLYGAGSGVAAALTESIAGGLGKGVKALGISRGIGGLDDIAAKKISNAVTKAITNETAQKVLGNTIEAAVKAGGEGLEEVAEGILSAVMKKFTYASNEEWSKLIADEKLLEQFAYGAAFSAIMQGGDLVKANASKTDFVTGMTSAEEKVINKAAEQEIAKREADGEKLTKKDKNEVYDRFAEDISKGYISIDTIEETLGGDKYTEYKKASDENAALKKELDELRKMESGKMNDIQRERLAELKAMNLDDTSKIDELKKQMSDDVLNLVKSERKGKGSLLMESYNEKARRGEGYTVDLNTIDSKKQDTYKRAIDAGILNNTNRTHDFVDLIATLESERGVKIDFVNNQRLKESGFAVDGAVVNGVKTDNGILLNVESKKSLNTVVGHEITHVLEGTELYQTLQDTIIKYAQSKGDYDTRYANIAKLYKTDDDVKIKQELAADLVGDYLFTDKNFIKNLTANPNVFQKVFNEIKYLVKIATTGSEAKRKLLEVQRAFERAWADTKATKNTTNEGGVEANAEYSLSKNARDDVHNALFDKHFKGDVKLTDNTPTIMLAHEGVQNLPMLMNASHLRENVFTEAEAKKQGLQVNKGINYHGLGETFFLEIIDDLDNVTEAYRGTKNAEDSARRENYFLLISKKADKDGNIINVPVYINDKGQYNRVFIDTNKIATVFGRSELRQYINAQLKAKNLVRIKTRSTQTSEATSPIDADYGMDASENSISQNSKKSSGLEKISEKGQFSLSDVSEADKKAHVKTAQEYFGTTYKWDETGYITLDGKRLDFSGKHDGAPGGYRTVDHRDIRDALGLDYGGDGYSDGMIQFMAEGNIRISPEDNGINLSVMPTEAQMQTLDSFITRVRGEVVLDIDDLNGNTIFSMEYPRGTYSKKILQDIEARLKKGGDNYISPLSQFRYSLSDADDIAPVNSDLAKQPVPTFYSHMGKVVDDIKTPKIGADSVVNYLKGRGVKDEEIKWSGIETFLEGKKSVTKEELQEFVNGSMLQIETETLGENPLAYTEEEKQELDELSEVSQKAMENAVNSWEEAYNESIPDSVLLADDMGAALTRAVINKHGGIRDFEGVDSLSEAEKRLYDSIPHTLKRVDTLMDEIVERAKARQKNTSEARFGQYKLNGGENYRELLFKMPNSNYTNQAMHTHWESRRGVLAHARVQDFDMPDGKMLFIEEIQSDWHNEGAKEGYADEKSKGHTRLTLGEYEVQDNGVPIATITDAYDNTYAYVMQVHDRYIVDFSNGRRFDSFPTEEAAISALEAQAQHEVGTPDAPFRNTYHEYVLKNLLRKAAEDGYSSIGWTTADIQSDRWSDEFAEGYRIEYDQDIPKFLNKYGKKWGAKVGTTILNHELNERDAEMLETERRNIAEWQRDLETAETDSEREFIQSQIDYHEEEIRKIVESGDKVWTMPITPAMKQSVLYEGQPLYSLSNADDIAPVGEYTNLGIQEDIAPLTMDSVDNTVDNVDTTMAQNDSGTTIKTSKEGKAGRWTALQTELLNNRALREESLAEYNEDIASLQAEYDAKKKKDTKVAQSILRRIERMKRLRDSTDADFAKHISDLETKEKLMSEGKPTTRQELHNGIMDTVKEAFSERGLDFDRVLKGAKNLSTFSTVDNTPQRVMEKALGYKEGGLLADLTVNKVAQNETEGIKWLNSFTGRKNGVLKQISNKYHIKPGSKESAAAQMYAEGFYVAENNDIISYGDAELAKDFPDARVQANIKGLASDPRIRQIYDDTLAMINESRTRNAYPEIPRLDNYFLHFRAMDDTFSKLGLPFNPNDIRAKDLPTDLNGVTADLKPGQPYFASAMHRTGKRTSFDLLGGLERYLNSAKNQIYHIDDIQTLRALRNYIADTYGQANGLEGLDALSEEEAQERIKEVYGSHLSTFAKFLNEEANVLAGKTALIDRGLEGVIGRRGMTFLNELNKQVGSNMVGYNISSSLTNFLPVAQTFAKSNKADFVKAFAQTVAHKVSGRSDGFAESSPVMIRRQGADRFYRTTWQKIGDPGYALMGAVDSISTEIIARTKYNELVRKGMDSQKAHYETDKWVSRLMGDRSLGQMPQLYNSKMLGLITKFQLEVRNQLDSQFYDTIQETKASNEHIENGLARNAKTAAEVASTFVQLAVVQHLFGTAFESIAGYNPAFDIIDVLMTAFGFDDDEESEDTVGDNLTQALLALAEDLPYTGIVLDGGRIPISSALPIEELVKGQDEWGNEKSRWETIKEAAPYYVLPGGYGQIKKTVQGLSMFSDDHPVAGSYTDSGNLRYPVEDTIGNRIQAALFGQYANENARYYFDNDLAPLKENQIQEYMDVGMPIEDYWDYREGLSGLKTNAEKIDYIDSLDLTAEQKNILANNILDRETPIDMTDYGDYSSLEEFDFAYKYPEKYEIAQTVGGYDKYVEYQEGMKDMKLAEKVDYVAGLDLTIEQKNALINGETTRKEPIDLTGYENYSSFDEFEYAKNNPTKYSIAKAVGGYDAYMGYSDALNDIKSDKDANGKTINGSRKEKVIRYIDSLDISYGEKIILFRSEYNADDSYNYDIIKYLEAKEGMTYEEKLNTLRALGFTVDKNGNIYW